MESSEPFENAVAWLKDHYGQFQFFVERDVVWILQNYLVSQIKEYNLPFRVFNDYPILPGKRRSLCVDLAILNTDCLVEVAAEFKYEPSHKRANIWPTKLKPSVVFWGDDGMDKDVKRVQDYVDRGKAKIAYAVFIDEGGYFRSKLPHPGSQWIDWNTKVISPHKVHLLWSRVSSS